MQLGILDNHIANQKNCRLLCQVQWNFCLQPSSNRRSWRSRHAMQSSHCAVRMVAKANAALQVQTKKARYSTYLRLVLQFIMLISIRRVLATTFS